MGDSILIGASCLCLGMFIGGIVARYIAKAKELTARAISGLLAVICGAGVLGIFNLLGNPVTTAYWWYPIGLFAGGALTAAIHFDGTQR